MEISEYRAFTSRLQHTLSQDERVLGLVAVGSMAEQDYGPDRWSDHDFFVITRPGAQDYFRTQREWLPDHQSIVFWLRETEHGVKAMYAGGHLLEFAVFDMEELQQVARLNRYRVLIDRGGLAELAASLAERDRQMAPAGEDADQLHFGQFVSNLMVGAGRYWRGERLSGHEFCQGYALRHLVWLIIRHVPAADRSLLDNLSTVRRFEAVYPELGATLNRLVRLPVPEAAAGLLDLAEQTLATTMASYPADQVALARRYLTTAGPDRQPGRP
jgi:lincosamide nucleotidyltransferase B/F